MKLSNYTLALLNDIENRIDPETEEDFRSQWIRFWEGETDTSVFRPTRKQITAPGVELKDININDCLGDWELMLDAQLADVSRRLAAKSPALGMRANYGTGIMPSLFGAKIFEMPRELNTLPTTKSLNDDDKIRAILEKGLPDLQTGYGKDVLRFGEICAEVFENYPKIKKYVEVYHPDTQGPLDVAELLWGGEMFYAMYEDPDFVHTVIRLITDTYKAFMDKWYSIVPQRGEYSVHWGFLIRGTLMIRLDSAMNISPAFYEEFSKQYDKELFDYYGGGCMHFCGRGDHFIRSMCDIDTMYAFNMSQPHLNNMDLILSAACTRNKHIIGLPQADQYGSRPDVLKGTISG